MGLATAHSKNAAQDWDLGKLEARLRLELFVMFVTASPEKFCGVAGCIDLQGAGGSLTSESVA